MTEQPHNPEHSNIQPEVQDFVAYEAQSLLEALGYSGFPQVVFGNAWQCDIRPDNSTVMVDQRAFGDETYKPAWRGRAFQHEVDAHYAKAKLQPESAQWHTDWAQEHPAAPIFLNVLSDIAGNREIASKDPGARADWDDFYRSKLFPETDYRFELDEHGQPTEKQRPRHIQMLYAMIREKMAPSEQCQVDPEVRTAIDELSHFNGDFNLLDFATQPFKSSTEYLTRMEQMRLWRNIVWPKYLELYEADLGDIQSSPQQGEYDAAGHGNFDSPFDGQYAEYEQSRHPGGTPNKADDQQASADIERALDAILSGAPKPSSSETISATVKSDETSSDEQNTSERNDTDPAKHVSKPPTQLEIVAKENGIEPSELSNYLALQNRVRGIIGDMHKVFEQFINERVATKWQLSHQHAEGVLLDPDNLARTVIQMTTGNTEDMRPYMDYEQKEKEREMSGKFDFWLVVDCSGSMQGTKAYVAAESTVAVLEGLNDFNNMVAEQSRAVGYELDYDARTAVVTFGASAVTTKPLANSLTIPERVQAVTGIQQANGSSTADYLGLDNVLDEYRIRPELARKKVVVVLTDGQSSSISSLQERLVALRKIPNLSVYAIGIQDENAEVNYAPNGKTIQSVEALPDTLANMVTRFFR